MPSYTNQFVGYRFEYPEGIQLDERDEVDPQTNSTIFQVFFMTKDINQYQYMVGPPIALAVQSIDNSLTTLQFGHIMMMQVKQQFGMSDEDCVQHPCMFGDYPGAYIQAGAMTANFYLYTKQYFTVRAGFVYILRISVASGTNLEEVEKHVQQILHTFEFLKDEPIKVNAAEFGEFYDASRGFLIRYPFNWHVKEGSRRPQPALEGNPTPAAATRLVDFELPSSELKLDVMVVEEVLPEGTSLAEYMDLCSAEMEKGMVYMPTVSNKDIKLNGLVGKRLYFEDDAGIKHTRVYTMKDYKIYSLIFNSNGKDMAEENMFSRMISSFRFVNPEEAVEQQKYRVWDDYVAGCSIRFPSTLERVSGGNKGGHYLRPINAVAPSHDDPHFGQGWLHYSMVRIEEGQITLAGFVEAMDMADKELCAGVRQISRTPLSLHGVDWMELIDEGRFLLEDGTMRVSSNDIRRLRRVFLHKNFLVLLTLDAVPQEFDEAVDQYKDVLENITTFDVEVKV